MKNYKVLRNEIYKIKFNSSIDANAKFDSYLNIYVTEMNNYNPNIEIKTFKCFEKCIKKNLIETKKNNNINDLQVLKAQLLGLL